MLPGSLSILFSFALSLKHTCAKGDSLQVLFYVILIIVQREIQKPFLYLIFGIIKKTD